MCVVVSLVVPTRAVRLYYDYLLLDLTINAYNESPARLIPVFKKGEPDKIRRGHFMFKGISIYD